MDAQVGVKYQLKAEDCLCQAELVGDVSVKEKWLKLAQAWQALANLNKSH
jgi:hypothetical protein